MRVYPSVLLQVGDLIESPNGGEYMRYVADVVEGIPLLCDGTHVFCPHWGFYFQTDYGSFIPVMEDSSAEEIDVSYFNFDNETT